jgi:hypothetical protein
MRNLVGLVLYFPFYYFRCEGNFYGRECEIDGEVVLVAIGASVAAVFIIVLTLVCLCLWRYVRFTPIKCANAIKDSLLGIHEYLPDPYTVLEL